MRKIKLLFQINLFQFLYLNFLCRKVERKGKGYIIPYWHAVIELNRSSKIILHDQHLWVNYYKPRRSNAEAHIRMAEDTVLEVTGDAKLYYRSTVELKKGARVTLGSTYLNCGVVLLAAESISIGNDVAIAMDVMIYDSDHHPIVDENGRQLNPPKPVVIKDHVWIGLRCVVLKGSVIGSGSVIAANSLVRGEIETGTMALGIPARPHSQIRWGS